MSPKHSSDRKPRFARLRIAFVLLGLLAFNVRPSHTHQLLESHSSTATFDHASGLAFCFECAFGSNPAVVSRDAAIPSVVGSTAGTVVSTATATSITLPQRCGRAPPAL